jgi:hypothetical protein
MNVKLDSVSDKTVSLREYLLHVYANTSGGMKMRRMTRLTNAFSKKLDNHRRAMALHYMHYNFCRVHQTLRVTPAMQAGVSDHVWTISEVVATIEVRSGEEAA